MATVWGCMMPTPMDEAWESLDTLPVEELGGSTGARLHTLPSGERFVSKRGASPEHLRNEYDINRYLHALGVTVPEAKLYEGDNPTMLTQYEEGAVPFNVYDKGALQRIRGDFMPHAALANWDVLGLDLDNVMIRPDGTPVYVDVGGAGPFRSQGAPKQGAWNPDMGELETMQYLPPHTRSVFGGMSEDEMRRSWENYGGQSAFEEALPILQDAATRNMMQQRIENIANRMA